MSSLAMVDLNQIDVETMDLVNGFIRNNEKDIGLTIPRPINLVIMKFYYVTTKLDICTTGKDVIKNDGKIFSCDRPGCHISAGASHGAKKGCFEYKINRFEKKRVGVGIGITSDIDNCKTDKWIYNWVSGKTYFIFERKENKGLGYIAGNGDDDDRIIVPKWKFGDVMKIEWDSINGIFRYYKNDKVEGTMEFEKAGRIYYPCVSMYGSVDIEVEFIS